MKGYKAFKKGLICDPTGNKPFQFAENTVFEERKAEVCKSGFHFCAEPMDVLNYYPPESEFAEVEALDDVKTDDSVKYVTKKIRIGAKISLKDLISAQVDIDFAKAKEDGSERYAQGDYGHAVAQGKYGHASAQGYKGHAAAQGYCGHAAAQGNYGHAEVDGKEAIAAAFGINGKAKACLGSWIMLAEWELKNGNWHIAAVKTAQIDGEKLKADTWYMLKNGEFEEVEE